MNVSRVVIDMCNNTRNAWYKIDVLYVKHVMLVSVRPLSSYPSGLLYSHILESNKFYSQGHFPLSPYIVNRDSYPPPLFLAH